MKKRNINLFIIGQAISLFGSCIFAISIPLFFLDFFANEINLGFFNTIREMPAIVLLPLLSIYIEYSNKKNIMVYSDLLQGLIYSLMLFLLLTNSLNIVFLILICCIADVITTQFDVATSVLFSHLVEKDELEKYNNIQSMLNNFISIFAPSFGAFIYMLFGMKAIILLNILSFFGSAFIEFFIEYKFEPQKKEKVNFIDEMKVIINYILNDADPYIKKLFSTVCVLNLFSAPFSMTLLPLITKNSGLNDTYFGIMMGFFTLGAILASILMIKLSDKPKPSIKYLIISNSFITILVGIFANLHYINLISTSLFILLVLISMTLLGITMTFVNIPLISGFQRLVDDNLKSKFFGALNFSSSILIPVGNFLVGLLLFKLAASNILILFASLSIIFVFMAFKGKLKFQDE